MSRETPAMKAGRRDWLMRPPLDRAPAGWCAPLGWGSGGAGRPCGPGRCRGGSWQDPGEAEGDGADQEHHAFWVGAEEKGEVHQSSPRRLKPHTRATSRPAQIQAARKRAAVMAAWLGSGLGMHRGGLSRAVGQIMGGDGEALDM